MKKSERNFGFARREMAYQPMSVSQQIM